MTQNYGKHVSAEQWNTIGLAFGMLQQEVRDALSVTPVISASARCAWAMARWPSSRSRSRSRSRTRNCFVAVDLDELQRDFESRKRLHTLELQLTQMLEQVRNAVVAHGSDAMAGALEIYGAVQDDEGEGADTLRKLLGKRFVRSAAKDVPEPGKA